MPARARFRSAALGVLCALAALPTASAAAGRDGTGAPPIHWMSKGLAHHPLVGQIWRRDGNRFVSEAELVAAAEAAPLVLIGEIHDNPDHHRIQARLTAALLDDRADRALAIEMIRSDQQPTLDTFLARRPGDLAGLGRTLEWSQSGWPAWTHYAAVLAPFVARRLAVLGANLPRTEIRAIARDGFAALGRARLTALALDHPIPKAVLDATAKEITEVHCGAFPQARAVPFAQIQLARDAAMAAALREAARRAGGKAVLIAGNGHLRTDRGVPWQLGRQGYRGRILTIAPMEVQADRTDARDYGAAYGTREAPFDYLWFTPRQRREDPCAALRGRE